MSTPQHMFLWRTGKKYPIITYHQILVRILTCAPTKTQKHVAYTSAQSDQSFRYPHEGLFHRWLSEMRPVKILIRLHDCAGWSESSLGAHV